MIEITIYVALDVKEGNDCEFLFLCYRCTI